MMPLYFDPLQIRRKLGRKTWTSPYEIMKGQWLFDSNDGLRVIVSSAPYPTNDEVDVEWLHASISRRKEIPTYADLVLLHKAVFNDGWAYQVFTPVERHINIHQYCLHLFGRVDGLPQLPDFQKLSGINSI